MTMERGRSGSPLPAFLSLWFLMLLFAADGDDGASATIYRHGVIVDYGQSLAQMVAQGKYVYVDGHITANHFPIRGSGKQRVVIELVYFSSSMSAEEVRWELESRGMRSATLPELLAFGATYPSYQRRFPIVALGSAWTPLRGQDYAYVPYLAERDARRVLILEDRNRRWGYNTWIAAVQLPADMASK
ncbi:MAG: hypothetical protein QY311_01005 [Candidatus Paceibacterota bacterium]|nr:MAG: hypothetical protein QY311_01005 [Candidatus Paceibacterota bacterium]